MYARAFVRYFTCVDVVHWVRQQAPSSRKLTNHDVEEILESRSWGRGRQTTKGLREGKEAEEEEEEEERSGWRPCKQKYSARVDVHTRELSGGQSVRVVEGSRCE